MMPTFPSSPLKFRTASFPRYGFKTGISAGAFPGAAPTCRAFPVCFPPSRYRCRRILLSPLRVGVRCAHQHHHSSSYAALPQEPSLRSGFCCPGPSTLNRPHPPHSRAQRDFTALQLIRPVFAVRYRLDDPRLVPCFHCHSFSTCRPLRLRGVQRLYTPSSFTANAGLRPFSTDSALPRFPQILSTWGHISELHYGSLALRPADLFTLRRI